MRHLPSTALDRARAVLTDLGARAQVERQIELLVRSARETLRQAPLAPVAVRRLTAKADGITAAPRPGPEPRSGAPARGGGRAR